MVLIDIQQADGLGRALSSSGVAVIHFWAPWSQPSVDMNTVLEALNTEYPKVSFIKLEAESFPDISERYSISAVPTFLFLKNGQVTERLNGANAPELRRKVAQISSSLATAASPAPSVPGEDLNARLKRLVTSAPVVLFMKGTADEPRCGFSRQTVAMLREHSCAFSTFNILTDEDVRQGLKKFSDWPTYPQLYINGEFAGGLDVLKEMDKSGELAQMLPKAQSLEDRLKQLVKKAPIVLFMKGSPDAPRCGFSRTISQLLNEAGLQFDFFDILQDEEVRQGLKKFSDWPTYPQVYVQGELVGGLDIVKEMLASGELKKMVTSSS